jgi:hypothetical protein
VKYVFLLFNSFCHFIFHLIFLCFIKIWKGSLWGSDVAIKKLRCDMLDPQRVNEFAHEVEMLW